MTNEENKKDLSELEGQEIDGNNVLGGGTDIGFTEDFSGDVGVVFETTAGMENMEPVDQMSIITETPTGQSLNPPSGANPSFNNTPGIQPAELK